MTNKIKAVVFDMDGLLFDTENLCIKSWDDIAMKMYGKEPTTELYHAVIGKSHRENEKTLKEFFGEKYDHVAFNLANREWVKNYMHTHGVPLKTGARELLIYLKENNFKIALASSTSASSVLHHLNLAQLTTFFDTIVCGDMVTNSKPNPEIFATACDFLKINPANTLGLEDSYNGVRSSSGAGLITVMVPDILPKNDEMEILTYRCVNSLLDIPKLIEEYNS